MSRRAAKDMRMPRVTGQAPEYPETLLRYPSAVMFLLMRELFRLSQERMARAVTAQDRMRFPHFATLACLEEFGPASQRDISDRLGFDPSDLVAFVDWLEEAGLVERRRDPRDRRRYAVDLTAAGRRALRTRARLAGDLNKELFRALSPEERELLHQLLLRTLRGRTV